MRSSIKFALAGAILLGIASAPVTANAASTNVPVRFAFTTPAGTAKSFVGQVAIANAAGVARFCSTTLKKTAPQLAAQYVARVPSLKGLTFVSATCVSDGPVAAPKADGGPAAVALFYSGGKDGLKYFLFADPNSPTTMDECRTLLSGVTAEYKNKVPTMPDFKGLKFVRSDCVLISDYTK